MVIMAVKSVEIMAMIVESISSNYGDGECCVVVEGIRQW